MEGGFYRNISCCSTQHAATSMLTLCNFRFNRDKFKLRWSYYHILTIDKTKIRQLGGCVEKVWLTSRSTLFIGVYSRDSTPRILRSYFGGSTPGLLASIQDTILYSHRYKWVCMCICIFNRLTLFETHEDHGAAPVVHPHKVCGIVGISPTGLHLPTDI